MLIVCPTMEKYRKECIVGPFLEAMKILRSGLSHSGLYAAFLSDSDPSKIHRKALGLYYMLKSWHDEMGLSMKL